MFADLHCHPSNRSFNRIRNASGDPLMKQHPPGSLPVNKTIWYLSPDDIEFKKKEQKKGFTATMGAYPQCDVASLTNADVRLVFAALYPIEKGFVSGNRRKGISAKSASAALKMILRKKRLGWLGKILAIPLAGVDMIVSLFVNSKSSVRDWIQAMIMRLEPDRIDFFQKPSYDYFREMQYERWLYEYGDGQPAPSGVNRYQLIRDSGHLKNVIQESPDIAVIQTIEGMHMLSQQSNSSGDPVYVGWDILKSRILQIKDWNIFFATFSHHYDNALAGHARSLPELLQEITDQVPRRHEGFHKDPGQALKDGDGMKAARLLLALDDGLQHDATLGRRVLLDLKHMAARARKEYYDEIIKPYNAANPNDKIPVVASHVGYANVKTLDELIARADLEHDESFLHSFYQWNINLCDEEVRIIVESGGIIGLSFDQRIIGIDLATTPQSSGSWAWYLANNIFAFVRACVNAPMNNPFRVWECIGLGTDFDGFIDPVDPFGTSERFGFCMSELLKRFEELGEATKRYLGLLGNPYTPYQVIQMIAFKNAYQFALKNFKP